MSMFIIVIIVNIIVIIIDTNSSSLKMAIYFNFRFINSIVMLLVIFDLNNIIIMIRHFLIKLILAYFVLH